MSDRSAKHLTLRELFTAAERQARELVTHLDLNFQSKLKSLERLVRSSKTAEERAQIADVTIRNHASQLLESEAYAARLYAQLDEYAQAIDEQVSRVVGIDPVE